jgi:tRNA nucleotidyltransferase (CCA-adding enzyme)
VRADALVAAGAALSTRDLAVNGNDLMRELSLAPGRIIGETLEHLVEVVTDDPAANERGRLLEAARAFVAARS